jgi:hypothetical protein
MLAKGVIEHPLHDDWTAFVPLLNRNIISVEKRKEKRKAIVKENWL